MKAAIDPEANDAPTGRLSAGVMTEHARSGRMVAIRGTLAVTGTRQPEPTWGGPDWQGGRGAYITREAR